jgi:hypothetical protein
MPNQSFSSQTTRHGYKRNTNLQRMNVPNVHRNKANTVQNNRFVKSNSNPLAMQVNQRQNPYGKVRSTGREIYIILGGFC